MKRKIIAGLGIIALLGACTKTGDCTVKLSCPSGFQTTTTAYDIEEFECQQLADQFENFDECTTNYEWLSQ